MAADFICSCATAAYLPARYIKPHLDTGNLHFVPDAPRFTYPVWVVWRDDLGPAIRSVATTAMQQVQGRIHTDQDAVIAERRDLGDGHAGDILGQGEPHD